MRKSISLFGVIMYILGVLCALIPGLFLYIMSMLHEDMWLSNSPFVYVGFIFVFAWLTHAFLGVAENERRKCRQLPVVNRGCSSFWFAAGLSILSALYFI